MKAWQTVLIVALLAGNLVLTARLVHQRAGGGHSQVISIPSEHPNQPDPFPTQAVYDFDRGTVTLVMVNMGPPAVDIHVVKTISYREPAKE